MGDSINLDWGAANSPAPSPVNAFMDAYQKGRAMGLQRTADEALQDAVAHPSDINALTRLSAYNPEAAKGLFGALDYQRVQSLRDAGSRLFQAYAMPQGQNAFTPPQAAPQGALPPVAPNASFDQAFAPVGAPGSPVPQSAPAQSTPLDDPTHPVAQQLGQAAMAGRLDPAQAWATLAQYANPADLDKYVTAIDAMDKTRLTRLAEANDALGAEAQSLLNVPQAQRAAELQRIAPMLMQHGITQEQIQGAMQQGLSDQYLQGIVGQALGTKGLLDQQNKTRELDTDQYKAETGRMTANTEAQGTGIADGFGNIVNNKTGQVMYGQGMPGNGSTGGAFAPQATAYADALKKQGLPDNAVAGIMGNLHIESGFDPSRPGDGGQAIGVAQWHPDRAAAFKAQFGVSPAQATPEQAAAFIKREISQLPAAQQQAILNATSPQAAAAAFDQYYERSNGQTRADRMAAAAAWASNGGAAGGGGLTSDAVHDQALEAIIQNGGKPVGTARNKGAHVAITNEISRIARTFGKSVPEMVAWSAANHADAQSLGALEKQATIVRAAEGAAQKNADLALNLSDKVTRGNNRVFNAWKNSWNTMQSDPATHSFAAALDTFTLEYAKVMGGGTPTVSGQDHARQLISTADSPQALRAKIETLKQDMANRRQAFLDERLATVGRMSNGPFASNSSGGGGKHFKYVNGQLVEQR